MGISPRRIRASDLATRCCHGASHAVGFFTTTLVIMAVLWIVWCYFGLALVQVSDGQRRALVQYNTPASKEPSTAHSSLYPTIPTVAKENALKPILTTPSSIHSNRNRVLTIASTRSPVRNSVPDREKVKESIRRNNITNPRRVILPNTNRRHTFNAPPKDVRPPMKVPLNPLSTTSVKPTEAPSKDENITLSPIPSENSTHVSIDENQSSRSPGIDVSKYGLASDKDVPVVFDREETTNAKDDKTGSTSINPVDAEKHKDGGTDDKGDPRTHHDNSNTDKENHHQHSHKDGCHPKLPGPPRRDEDRYDGYDDDYRYSDERYPYGGHRYRPHEDRYGGRDGDRYIPREDDRYRPREDDRYRPRDYDRWSDEDKYPYDYRDRFRDEEKYRTRYWYRPRGGDWYRPRNGYKDRVPYDYSHERRYPNPTKYDQDGHRNRDIPSSKVPSDNGTHIDKDGIQSSRSADVDVSKYGLASDKDSPVVLDSHNTTTVAEGGGRDDTKSHDMGDDHHQLKHSHDESSAEKRPDYPRRRDDDDRYSDYDDDYRYSSERRPYRGHRYRPDDDRYGGRDSDRYTPGDDDRYRTRDYEDRYRPRDYDDRWRDDDRYKYDYRDRYRDEERYRPRYGNRGDRYRPREGYRDRYPDDYSYERRRERYPARDGYRPRDHEDRYKDEAADKISPTRVKDDSRSPHHRPDDPRSSHEDSRREHQTRMPGERGHTKHEDGVGLERRSYGSEGNAGSKHDDERTSTKRDSSDHDDAKRRRGESDDDDEYPRRSTNVEYPRRRIKDDEDYRRNRPRDSPDNPRTPVRDEDDKKRHGEATNSRDGADQGKENSKADGRDTPSRDTSGANGSRSGDRPLSAKDIIEAAQRQPDSSGQGPANSVSYPSSDPRRSNLTNTDIIRPSERRGITIHSRRKRWVIL